MTRGTPPVLLRLAVIVGGVTLVFGIVGLVLLVVVGGEDDPVGGPGLGPLLRIRGVPLDGRLTVDVIWEEDEAAVRQSARPTRDATTWILPPLPADRPITIEVKNTAAWPPQVCVLQRRRIAPGEEVVVDFSKDGATSR